MPYIPTATDILCTRQTIRQYYIRVELLNKSYQILDTLQYELISGTYTEDAESDMRRICDLTFVVKNATYFADQYAKIWMDKYVRIYLGLDYVAREYDTVWYPLGIYLFNDTSFTYDLTSRTVTVSCLDFMSLFTGDRNGVIPALTTKVLAGENMTSVIATLLRQFYGITDPIIVENETIPYDIEMAAGATFYDLLREMKDLYPGREMYFDEDGIFTWKKIPTESNETNLFDDTVLSELIIRQSTTRTFSEIKNCIRIYGQDDEVWTAKLHSRAPSYQEDNTTYIIEHDNPYSIEQIGEVWNVFSGGHYEKIYTPQLLSERCVYELWLATNWNETITLEGMLIPFLRVNTKFSYKNKLTGEYGDYIVKSVNFDFDSGTMQLTCLRYYPLYEFL